MGQYYKPMSLERKEYLYTHDYGEGLKLMEHSYIGNSLMNAIEGLLIPGGPWYKSRIVWAGDYADAECEPGMVGDEERPNLYSSMRKEGKKISPPGLSVHPAYHYLTNHTQHTVVDLNTIEPDAYGFRVHPLALLTAEGNGRGGGDFRGDATHVGTWARDVIALEDHIPEGYTLQRIPFVEV